MKKYGAKRVEPSYEFWPKKQKKKRKICIKIQLLRQSPTTLARTRQPYQPSRQSCWLAPLPPTYPHTHWWVLRREHYRHRGTPSPQQDNMTTNKVPTKQQQQTSNNTNYMQSKRANMCNRKIQNCVLSNAEPPATNIIKDRYKHKIKNRYHTLYAWTPIPKQ